MNNNLWRNTITGKKIVFWIFSILLPIICVISIIICVIYWIKIKNNWFILPLVLSIISFAIVWIDIYAVVTMKSDTLLRVMGIVSIFTLALIVQGIKMIEMADYVYSYDKITPAESWSWANDSSCNDEKNNNEIKNIKISKTNAPAPIIRDNQLVTSWAYDSKNKTLRLYFDNNKKIYFDKYPIKEDFISNVWRKYSLKEQTVFYYKFWHNVKNLKK